MASRASIWIVLTDGQSTDARFFLDYQERRLVYGSPRVRSHHTYPADGRRHYSRPDGRDWFDADKPLASLDVQRILVVLPFEPRLPPHPMPYRARAHRQAIFVDVRSIRAVGTVIVGVLEPGRIDAAQGIAEAHRPIYGAIRSISFFAPGTPWIYVAVLGE